MKCVNNNPITAVCIKPSIFKNMKDCDRSNAMKSIAFQYNILGCSLNALLVFEVTALLIPLKYETNSMAATPFMVFCVMCTICKEPKLDAWRSPSVTSANCRYDTFHQHKFLKLKTYLHYDI